MYPILFQLGPFIIYSWGFMLAVGVLTGMVLALVTAKSEGLERERVLDLTIYILISAIVGARIFYVIQFWSEFKNNLIEIIMVNQGGLVFYGGLIAVLLTIWCYTQRHKLSIWKVLDLATPSTALGYSIARLGCFLNGCCYGIETNVPWAVHFPHLSGLRHPTQIYSSITVFTIFLLLLFLKRYRRFEGWLFLMGIMLYSVYRFLIEFLRFNPSPIFGLSASQIISAVLFVGALTLLTIRSKRAARSERRLRRALRQAQGTEQSRGAQSSRRTA